MTLQGWTFRALLRLFALLPPAAGSALGGAIGRLFRRFPNRTRNVARRNLELCFPALEFAQREALLAAYLAETGRGLVELGTVWFGARSKVLGLARRVHGREHLERALAARGGVLVISPHLGSWEWLVQFLAERGPCTFFYREPKDSGVDRVITAGRERFGARMVKAGAKGVRRALRALKQGQIVGVMPDQQPKLGQGQFSPFFGIPALTMVLASKLARRSGAAVLFVSAVRLPRGQGFEVHIEPADERVGGEDLSASIAAVNAQVEALARRWPAQYQWGYKRFSIRSPGEPGLY